MRLQEQIETIDLEELKLLSYMLSCFLIHSLQTVKNHSRVTDHELAVIVHETF